MSSQIWELSPILGDPMDKFGAKNLLILINLTSSYANINDINSMCNDQESNLNDTRDDASKPHDTRYKTLRQDM